MRLFGLGILAVAIITGAIWAAWQATAHPRIAVAPSAVDFGPVTERKTRTIEVRNSGRATLQILAVTSSCGCTIPAIDATALAPRSATHLTITFDPAAHGPQAGPARHSVYLRTNDPRVPETEIEVRAIVVKGAAR
jgi:hypothetical protein